MSSSKQSYDGDDSDDKSDSLICGFGPRRGRRISGDDSSASAGASNNMDDVNASLICGFGGGDGNSFTSSGQSMDSNTIAALFEDNQTNGNTNSLNNHQTTQQSQLGRDNSHNTNNGGHHYPQASPHTERNEKNGHDHLSTVAAHSEANDDIQVEHLPLTVPTKTDPSGSPRRPIPRVSSSRSVGSEGDMSMASEDAIVLMINMLENGEEGSDDVINDKGADEKEIIGRVYKKKPTDDYASIPVELEINPSSWESMLSPASSNLGRQADTGRRRSTGPVQIGKSAEKTHDKRLRRSSDGILVSTSSSTAIEPKPHHSPVRSEPIIDKTVPKLYDEPLSKKDAEKHQASTVSKSTARHVSINNNVSHIDNVSPSQPPSYQTKTGEPVKSFAMGFPSTIEPIQPERRRSSGMDQGLDVIAEDEATDDSTAANSVFKSSQTSKASTRAGSQSSATSYEDVIEDSFSMPTAEPMGEHAKSMARQLGMVDKSSSNKRRMPTKSKSSRKLEEEGRRAIVSRDTDTEYVKKVVEKSDEVKKMIREAIATNILFKACSDEELDELVEVFAPSEAAAGSTIIKEGDEGDAFFYMERGTVDVYEGDVHKVTLYSGVTFGEIALLYGCPRSATLRSRYFCKLWSISRTAFRAITSDFKRRRMDEKVDFLKKVKIKDKSFSELLSESEISTLALACLTESFEPGHVIVREGEPGDIFYMIDSGSVDVFIKSKGSKPVVTLESGKFFGELALLSSDVRTASCIAKTSVKCHILMRNDFNLLLGDLQSLLDGNDYKRREAVEVDKPRKAVKLVPKVKLSDLEIMKVLGVGAFGRVRLVKLRHPIDGIKEDGFFALKCISKKLLTENGLMSHILNEKSIMAGMEHPFINRFYCDMDDDKYLYFLLEALTGGELCKRLREEKKFSEKWGKFYSASVLFAFCHMHAKKIAYRDLKPENLVMDSTGYVKVVDFGLAKVIEGGKTWTLCGTPAYLAPEIVLNDGHDWAVDYWALGVLLFEMTSGKEPFAAKNPMEVYKQIVSGHVDIPPEFSSNLSDLIRKLLNVSKSKRLGRTMGGGGAVMQHRWYGDYDFDAHLEKRLAAPLKPKTEEILSGDSVTNDSDSKGSISNSKASNSKASNSKASQDESPQRSRKKGSAGGSKQVPRMTYSLGQGNRHHQKLLEMMDNSVVESNVPENDRHDNLRMTMMRVIKQHERWSKTSVDSTNSSTRNTNLATGRKRESQASTGGDTIGSNILGDENLDAFLRLQLMHLSLSSNRQSQTMAKDRAFQQFSLLSVRSASLFNEPPDYGRNGSRFLDPFVTKRIDLIDQFPKAASESDIDGEALAAFCFPNGLRIRLIPRCAVEGARRLGWLGEHGDKYQLQGFTDVAGSLSHGVAITVTEELTNNDASKISSVIELQREKRRAAVVIARWYRIQFRRPRRTYSGRRMKRANSAVGSGNKGLGFNRKGGAEEGRKSGRNSGIGIRAAMDKMMYRSRMKSSSMGDIAFDESDHSDNIDESDPYDDAFDDDQHSPPVSEYARRMGISAYQAMVDSEKEGDICIVEKSYIIIGMRLVDQSLFFCALQNLIDMERKINVKAAKIKRQTLLAENPNTGVEQLNGGAAYSFDPENRSAVLATLQSRLSLSRAQRRITYPRDEVSHVQNPQRRFIMDLKVMGFSKVSLPLPLPEVSGQWGLATLFLRIKDSGLIILLKLLLLERSVLVVGQRSEEVTACATALLELLDPYKWASAFMPLLPREMLDFVSSPVPFIAGMLVEGKQDLHSVIHDHGVKDAMLNGLSIVNLVSGKLIVTREQGTSDMLRRSFQTIPELALYQKRLESYFRDPSSNLRSFQAFFRNGASLRESLTLGKVKKVIKKHLSQFTMGLNDKPDAWQQYGEFNQHTGAFDFCPDKFIQPLKDRMIFQIQFQEMMTHTQLFVGYVEELQVAHEKRSILLSGHHAQFIARWVELHWAKYSRC